MKENEKQAIEEMARIIGAAIEFDDLDFVIEEKTEIIAEKAAEKFYAEGYRKQSEGEWEKRTFIIFDSEKVGYKCSECNTTWDAPTNFCPNCGAHMKGGAE